MLTKTLLSKGYFPQLLPPVFTTSDFGDNAEDILGDWGRAKLFEREKDQDRIFRKGPKKAGAYRYKLDQFTEAEVISKPKRGYERRNFHLTHPLPQALLSKEIGENWRKIYTWLQRAEYSIETVNISGGNGLRATQAINFIAHREKKLFIEASNDWLVSTDITRFYPSIYTHSIPWAAYGKAKVKKSLKLYAGSLADRLDTLVRACNRNQTVGIPIGPDTSRVLAEVISARIDSDISGSTDEIVSLSTDRLQDDWLIGVHDLPKAERALAKLSAAYENYGLEINGSKTSIDHILQQGQRSWIADLRSFLAGRETLLSASRFQDFLDLALQLQAQFTNEPVIKYALSAFEGSRIPRESVPALESFLLKSAVVSPGAMDKICQLFLDVQFQTQAVSVRRVSSRLCDLAVRNMQRGHHFEVIWLLYTLRGLKAGFSSKEISELAEQSNSATIALLLLDMKDRGIFKSGLPKSYWENISTEESIKQDWTWLLAYEGIRNGWLNDPKGLMATDLFSAFASRKVVFYDKQQNMKKAAATAKTRKNARKKDLWEARELLAKLRGVELTQLY